MRKGREGTGGRAGFTLVEVMVATLMTAALAVALMNVALTTKTTSVKLDRKLLASQTTKALQSQLKAYVTSDPLSPNDMGRTKGLCGPNTFNGSMLNCNTDMWCLSNPVQSDAQSGGANACYALNAGSHTIRCLVNGEDDRCVMPWALRQSPYFGYIVYTVIYPANSNAPQVQINVHWTEPPQ